MSCLVSLLEKLKKQPNEIAWEAIVNDYGKELYSISLGILGDKHLAEDATQNTLLAIRNGINTFQTADEYVEARAYAWIRRIACLQSLQLLRSHDRTYKREALAAQQPKHFLDPAEQIMHEELTDHIRIALADMPERQRQPLVLAYYGGLSHQDLALELGCSPGTARTRVHRCLKALRKRLIRVGVSCTLASLSAQMHAASSCVINPTLLASWNKLLASSQTSTAIPEVALQGVTFMTKISIACVTGLIVGAAILSIDILTEEELEKKALTRNEEPISINIDEQLHEKIQKKTTMFFTVSEFDNRPEQIDKIPTLSDEKSEHILKSKASVSFSDVNFYESISILRDITGNNFIVDVNIIQTPDTTKKQTATTVTLNAQNQSLRSILDELTTQTKTTYFVNRDVIYIRAGETPIGNN